MFININPTKWQDPGSRSRVWEQCGKKVSFKLNSNWNDHEVDEIVNRNIMWINKE